MVDPLSNEGESQSGTKPDFVGRIVDTAIDSEEYPSQYESDNLTVDLLYEIEVLAVENEEGELDSDVDWENQTTRWVDVNTTVQTGSPPSTSKWMVLVNRLNSFTGNLAEEVGASDAEDVRDYVERLLDWMEGQTFRFTEFDWSEDEPEMEFSAIDPDTGESEEVVITPANVQANSSQQMNEFIVPTGKPDDDTIVDLTGEPEVGDDVEEVSAEEL